MSKPKGLGEDRRFWTNDQFREAQKADEKTRYCVCGAKLIRLKSLDDMDIYVCVSCNPTIKSIPRRYR